MSNNDGRILRMELDCSAMFEAEMPAAEQMATSGQLPAAVERLMTLEKTSRNSGDMSTNVRVQVAILDLCRKTLNWSFLNECIVTLSKKHGAIKQATQKMIEKAVSYVNDVTERATKLELINTLRAVTEGKIYVEVDRARLTRILAKIKEEDGQVNEAADILQELQVETFSSMEKREKVDFILEQMRLCLAKKDYTRTLIISRKISKKYLALDESQDLKLRFYELVIKHAVHEAEYLEACKCYRQIFDTPLVLEDPKKWQEALSYASIFGTLAPHDSEQYDILKSLVKNHHVERIPIIRNYLKFFVSQELISWKMMEANFGAFLHQSAVFNMQTEDGKNRWTELRKRVVEHNIRVISTYYSDITYERLGQLLDEPIDQVELYLSSLVTNKTIFARIDRPKRIIDFAKPKDPEDVLNEWSGNIHELLKVFERTTHLITKEEMVNTVLGVATQSAQPI